MLIILIILFSILNPNYFAANNFRNVFNALALTITGGASIYYNSDLYHRVYSSSLLFIPTPVCVVIVMFIFTWILLNKSKLGMQIRALGGNREALKLAGVNVVRSEITVYAVAAIQGHKMGPTAGARAMRQAIDIVMKGGSFVEECKAFPELAESVSRWGYVS